MMESSFLRRHILDNKVKKSYWGEKAEALGIDTDNMRVIKSIDVSDSWEANS